MTREIIFRGKRIDNGEWVKGFPYITHGGEHQIRYYDSESNIENCSHTVIPDTLGRFTGLTDRNSTKIFEGDIIRWHDNTELSVSGQIAEVCLGKYRDADSAFDDVYAIGFYLRTSGGECVTICWLDEYKNDFDIIGNIHDTPELLEVSGDEA